MISEATQSKIIDWLGIEHFYAPWKFSEDSTIDARGEPIVTFHMPAPREWRNSPLPGLVTLSDVKANRRHAARVFSRIDTIWSAMLEMNQGHWLGKQTRRALRESIGKDALLSDLATQSWSAQGSTVYTESGLVVATVHSLLFRADIKDQQDFAYAQHLLQQEARVAQAVALLPQTLRCAQVMLHETDQAALEACRDFCAALEHTFAPQSQNEEEPCSLKMAA